MNATAFPDVGAILKKARESQGLSVQEAADALHLRPSIVVAIEGNEFSEVPGTTFLKGYVKSYARLLKLSETEILDYLQQALDVETSTSIAATAPDTSKSGRNFVGLFLFVAILISAAGLYSWQEGYIIVSSEDGLTIQFSSHPETKEVISTSGGHIESQEVLGKQPILQEESRPDISPPSDSSTTVTGAEKNGSSFSSKDSSKITTDASHSLNVTTMPAQEVETAITGSDEVNVKVQTGYSAAGTEVEVQEVIEFESQPVAASEDKSNDASYVADYPNTADETTVSSDDFGQQQAVDTVEITPEVAAPANDYSQPIQTEAEAPATGVNEIIKETDVPNEAIPSIESITGEIVATFSGDCWFQVKNGDGKVVLAALKHGGDTASYSGVLPFQVVIGAVSEVQLTFNGNPVDFNRFRVWNNRTDFILE